MVPINIQPGDLRTKIRVQRCIRSREDGEIEDAEHWVDIGNQSENDPPRHKYVQWIGAHGSESWTEDALQGTQMASIRLRFDKDITQSCRILLHGDRWEIISVDDIHQAHTWMELKAARKVAG